MLCDSAIRITWVHVSRLPIAALRTMTNGNTPCSLIKLSISVDHHVKIIYVKWLKTF